MQLGIDTIIIISGEDRTDSVASCTARSGKYDIIYHGTSRVYSYSSTNVKVLKLIQKIDPTSVVFKANGHTISLIDEILDFGEFYRIKRKNYRDLSYRKAEVNISKNCLYDAKARDLFNYFKATAKAVSLKAEHGFNILGTKYEQILSVEDFTVLAKYLKPNSPIETKRNAFQLIYPFGLNQSQKTAIQNAFSSQISIIQGPPGTGKTQTILNIIANAVRNGNTVAVISNNNYAIQNIAEKLEKHKLSFLAAFLGSHSNKEKFIAAQSGIYPQMASWVLPREKINVLNKDIHKLSDELTFMMDVRTRIAHIDQELLDLQSEHFYFEEYYKAKNRLAIDTSRLERLPSRKLLSLWLEYEFSIGRKVGLIKKILIAMQYGSSTLKFFSSCSGEAIPLLQKLYYKNKASELQAEKKILESQLKGYHFEKKMDELRQKSMTLFKAELAHRYYRQLHRRRFELTDLYKSPDDFTKEYPVILSTTYSIKGTLSTDYVYDYVIVDEASQVDLVTGVLAFSCAKNIVIVGDQQQLPNVLTPQEVSAADSIWNQHNFDEQYHFTTHSMLTSAIEIWPSVPSTLLREHYRCHPKIAAFFNQKFYKGELIVMTEDHGEEDVLTMYRTAPGNHARGHLNQRQIDVIKMEVLPKLTQLGYTSIGIISPYRDQVAAIQKQLGDTFEVATVHKFQGREKDAIILTSVDNIVGDFVDDPNMLNVAVSRAIRSLSVVISSNAGNSKTNYGDLAKYIEYNNLQIIDSKVFSVFDLLYKEYNEQRIQYLKKHKRVSVFDSENLAYSIIEKVLSMEEFSKISCVVHSSLTTLIKDFSILTEEEAKFASNPLTHIDFLLFNKMDKSPVIAIEIDGTKYHAHGSRQEERDKIKDSILVKCCIPLLRIRTNENDEKNRIASALHNALI